MKSPFPGMDPYLQRHWRDVHTSLVTYARDQLQPVLPAGLVARIEERVYLEEEGELGRSFYPDVLVVQDPGRKKVAVAVRGEVALAEPIVVKVRSEPITERFVQILDAESKMRVISTIEFISPTNKTPGEGYDLYRKKQRNAERAGISLMEIDLILGGKRVLSVPLTSIKFRHRTRYQAIVRRGWNWEDAEVFPLHLNERLPTIPVPMRRKDRDARLDLQALIDLCYVNGAYETIDYQEDADPPLEGHDAEWADPLLRKAGKRK